MSRAEGADEELQVAQQAMADAEAALGFSVDASIRQSGCLHEGQWVDLSTSLMQLPSAIGAGACRPFLVADLPFGSYEVSAEQAVRSAVRLLKEANMDAVKMEGGAGLNAALLVV